MPEAIPVKCSNDAHRPFAADDTVPTDVLNLLRLIHLGPGLEITIAPDGRLILTNTCCP